MNDSRSRVFGTSRDIARSGSVYCVGDLRSGFGGVDSGVGSSIYHQLRTMSPDCCVYLCPVGYVAVAATKAGYLKTRRCRPEKLDAELPSGSHDERAHYSLRIWVR